MNAPGRNLVINASMTISPKVVNEVEYVDAWGAINSTLNGIANSPTFLSQLTNNTKYTDPNGRAPNVGFTGGTQAVPALTGLGNGSAPYFERNIDKNIFDNLSIQHGNHTIRMGATAMWMQKTENARRASLHSLSVPQMGIRRLPTSCWDKPTAIPSRAKTRSPPELRKL